jgi:threonine/homoserine/homoserine lactone efflux protein
MPSPHTLLLFSLAALALLVLPGPSVLYITARSAAQGRRAGLVSVLGVHTGTMVHVAGAVVGLSGLLMASALAYSAVRWIGAAYLIVLGLRTIVRRHREAGPADLTPRSLRRLYLDGAVVNALNPKTALFFLAFLPQFVDPAGGPVWLQTLALGFSFGLLGICSDGLYALVGAGVGRWLRRRDTASKGPLVEGGLLVGLGLFTVAVPGAHHD